MNQIYDQAARALMLAQLNWPNTEMVLVAWGGTPLFDATHVSVAAVRAAAGATELGSSLPITSRTVAVDGTGQTNKVVIQNMPIGPPVTWFTLCKDVGDVTLAQPILFIDDAVELPFIPNGTDMVISPDWSANRGWFRP